MPKVASKSLVASTISITFLISAAVTGTAATVPSYDHIVIVVEENHDYSQIIGNTHGAPYINFLAAHGASLTNYLAITHPSEPNYLALYAGSTFGITDDSIHLEEGPTVATILKSAGKSFTGYVEHPDSSYDHNPWESFPEDRSVERDFGAFPTGHFGSLATVSFVIPNVENDMHNGSVAQGDAWLYKNIRAYAEWARSNNSLLVLTWDENDGRASNHVPMIMYGAHVVAGNYSVPCNHYNLVSTMLAGYHLSGPRNAESVAPIAVFAMPSSPMRGDTEQKACQGRAKRLVC